MSERLLIKAMGKDRVLVLKPEEFQTAKKAVKYEHMVRHAVLLGVKDAATAPRVRVHGTVMESVRLSHPS